MPDDPTQDQVFIEPKFAELMLGDIASSWLDHMQEHGVPPKIIQRKRGAVTTFHRSLKRDRIERILSSITMENVSIWHARLRGGSILGEDCASAYKAPPEPLVQLYLAHLKEWAADWLLGRFTHVNVLADLGTDLVSQADIDQYVIPWELEETERLRQKTIPPPPRKVAHRRTASAELPPELWRPNARRW